jgi:hypothetical protein
MNEHIAGEDLAAYVEGSLKGGPRSEVEAHLSRCPDCLRALAEISAIRGRGEKIPQEFVRQALRASTGIHEGPLREGALRGRGGRAKAAPPMRLLFGIAAVFLVVVLAGYYFFDRGRTQITGGAEAEKTRPAVAREDSSPPGRIADKGKTSEEKAMDHFPEYVRREAKGLKVEAKTAARQGGDSRILSPAGKAEETAALPEPTAQPRLADEQEWARPQDAAAGAVGGVLGRIEAPLEKDKEKAQNLAAAPTLRKKGGALDEGQPLKSRGIGPGESIEAAQILLALAGRAAAPRLLPGPTLPSTPAVQIAGDVSRADLSNPGLLDSWSWFPEGRVLELEIDAKGAVVAVTPLGPWGEQSAARAQSAARELRFSASGMKSRRAVLTLSALPPN